VKQIDKYYSIFVENKNCLTHSIKIYGDIVPFNYFGGDFSIENLTEQLDKLSVTENDEVIVSINTFGGDVDAGFSIYNILRRFAKENSITITTRLDGYCASIGTVILLAGDKRIGNEYASPFVHNAWFMVAGDSNEMKKAYLELEACSNTIAQFYASHIDISFETAKELMDAETWIKAGDALKYGFFTEIENNELQLPKKAMYNLLKENNFLRNNKQNNKMTAKEKFKNFMNDYFGKQNKIVFDAESNEIDFYELGETDEPKVGDKAKYKGQPADGEILSADGKTYIFDKGTLTEIVEVIVEVVETETELELVKEENKRLLDRISEIENNAKETTDALNKFKNLYSDFELEDKKQNGQNHKKQTTTNSAFIDALKKVK
jgi:ATP-dependent protease ClpP protease subunit